MLRGAYSTSLASVGGVKAEVQILMFNLVV